MANPWLTFVKKHWPASKKKGIKYSQHLKDMAVKYKKKGAGLKNVVEEEMIPEVPKKKRRKKRRLP